MPKVTAQNKTFECSQGANLRKVLLENDVDLYNGNAKIINCMGIGTCGTCAVMITGAVSPSNWRDRTRRSLPPHDPNKNLRLAFDTHRPISAVILRSQIQLALVGLLQPK